MKTQMFVSEIRAQYVDENDLFRTVLKRIYEGWDADREQWHLKRIEYIFEDPEYPVPSKPVIVPPAKARGLVNSINKPTGLPVSFSFHRGW